MYYESHFVILSKFILLMCTFNLALKKKSNILVIRTEALRLKHLTT